MPDERVSSSSHTTERGGGNGFLYFAVGALIIAVAVLAWMFYGGGWGNSANTNSADSAIERSADAVGDAADRLGDAASRIPTPAPAQPAPAQPSQPEPSTPAPTTPPG